jgi:soluble lytic murein transglycosylase-like protein
MTLSLMALFLTTSWQFNLPPGLLASICYTESKYDVTVIHKDDGGSDSIGVCQIKYDTAKDLGFTGTQTQLLGAETNIYYAAKYLHKQLLRYPNNNVKAIIAYNMGHAGTLTSTNYSVKVIEKWRSDVRESIEERSGETRSITSSQNSTRGSSQGIHGW